MNGKDLEKNTTGSVFRGYSLSYYMPILEGQKMAYMLIYNLVKIWGMKTITKNLKIVPYSLTFFLQYGIFEL